VYIYAIVVGISLLAVFGYRNLSLSNHPNNLEFSIKRGTDDLPNIVIFFVDDLAWNSVGYETEDLTGVTPFISKMADHGIIMKNYYSQEMCTPARAALLTGRYPHRYGLQYSEVIGDSTVALNVTETLLPEVLRTQGYTNYMLGKWNLGHYSEDVLPTARGFDYFLGYVNSGTYHWSKLYCSTENYYDLMYANTECYSGYNGSDMTMYSTLFYTNKAKAIVSEHDYSASPLFLYFAYQGVHDPFPDLTDNENGLTSEYFSSEVYETIMANVVGSKRQQYAMSLALIDQSVASVYHAMDAVGQADNTYFIFA